MTITYNRGANPLWYFPDLAGLPLTGGQMFSYSNLNRSQLKPIYMDPAGDFPWPNPIVFESNGLQGPFYFQVDDTSDDSYFLVVFDNNGVEQFTIEDYLPGDGGGGGGVEINDLVNLVINGTMLFNVGQTATPINAYNTFIATGPHAGFSASGDIQFVKSNFTAVDQITMNKFILGTTPLTNDITPEYYASYSCTNSPGSETYKYFNFPIANHVKNLEGEQITISLEAKSAISNNLNVFVIQNFGNGGSPSPQVTTTAATFNLTSSWQKYEVTLVVPNCSGKVLGLCGDDYLSVGIGMQLGVINQTDFTNVQVIPGNISPPYLYQTPQMVAAQIFDPRTGVHSSGWCPPAPFGWLPLSGGSIGSATSGATARANIDTFPLYYFVYSFCADAQAPVAGGRSGNPFTDFAANKALTLPASSNRVFENTFPGVPNGTALGSTTATASGTLTNTNIPPSPRNYQLPQPVNINYTQGGTSNVFGFLANATVATTNGSEYGLIGAPFTTNPFSVLQPTVTSLMYIKL
jgi:hypothetical protein